MYFLRIDHNAEAENSFHTDSPHYGVTVMYRALMHGSMRATASERLYKDIGKHFRLLHSTTSTHASKSGPSRLRPNTPTKPTEASSAATVAALDEPMPRAARYLGLSGTIPFFATAGLATCRPELAILATDACAAYGCSILSFLGAVHWGIALRSHANMKTRHWDFAYSVSPAIAAAGLTVLPTADALTMLFPSFGAALVYDSARFAGDPAIPTWYTKLRRPLTAAAMTSTGVCLAVLWTQEPADSTSSHPA